MSENAEPKQIKSKGSGASRALFQRPVIQDDAVLTSLVRYGESDCIVRLFCREQGRVSAFAPRGLKPSKNRGGVIQVPALAVVSLRKNTHGELLRLADIDIAPSSFSFVRDLKTLGWASYVVELVEVFIHEHEPFPDFFDLLSEALRLIGQGRSSPTLLRAFELQLLELCGYLPDFSTVVDFPGRTAQAFDLEKGHLLADMSDGAMPFSVQAQQLALTLLHTPLSDLPDGDEALLRMIGRVFAWRLRLHRAEPLKSVVFLKDVGI